MKTHIHSMQPSDLAFTGLSGEQRVLVEQVSASSGVFASVRNRARALLLLDQGAPVDQIQSSIAMDRRTVRSLIVRHRKGGVCAALLGIRHSPKRRHWLALSPMRH